MNKTIIFLFARAPIIGTVKTRLSANLGKKNTLKAYKIFLDISINKLLNLNKIDKAIFYWPPKSKYFFRYKKSFKFINAQHGSTFNKRLFTSFKTLFDKGYKEVIVYASDSPDLPKQFLIDGIKKMKKNDVIIGQTKDGGYYCLGLKKINLLSIINKIKSSQSDTAKNIIKRLESVNCKIYKMKKWYDIDTKKDLEVFLKKNKLILNK